jgi:hypothetical protein
MERQRNSTTTRRDRGIRGEKEELQPPTTRRDRGIRGEKEELQPPTTRRDRGFEIGCYGGGYADGRSLRSN